MENLTLQQLITQTKEALTQAGASNYYQKVFKTLTNQLLLYAEEHNTDAFSMDFGLQFLEDHYSMSSKIEQKKWCATYSRCINALAEYQRSGSIKGIRQYADAPAERVSLKAKLEVMKAKVAGEDTEKPMPQKVKGKEETL